MDSLDVGLYVDWSLAGQSLFSDLADGKLRAAGTGGVPFGDDGACLLLPSGKPPSYAYHLQYPEFHLFLANTETPRYGTPNAYLSLNCSLLWSQWIPGCLNEPLEIIERLGGECQGVKPSRLDLCADLLVPGGFQLEYLQKCRSPRDNKQRQELDGERLETYYVGARQSPIQMRLYDKGREIRHGGTKYWFNDIWGTETVADVWRTEFQLRRPVLKEYQIHDCESLLESLPGIWHDLTTKWITFRHQGNDSNLSRAVYAPWWQAVIDAGKTFGAFTPVSRQRTQSAASIEWYLSHIGGCLISFAARRHHPHLDAALYDLTQLLQTHLYLQWREAYFEKCVKLGIDPGYLLRASPPSEGGPGPAGGDP
ncbi:hypothetical protein [Planctomicrobium sp. SH664]|uniref:hypothetical protein n=1 Tax=Planctomicrobium sp. SH664 TaxID=3448125 RepID=UPI003F5B8AC6